MILNHSAMISMDFNENIVFPARFQRFEISRARKCDRGPPKHDFWAQPQIPRIPQKWSTNCSSQPTVNAPGVRMTGVFEKLLQIIIQDCFTQCTQVPPKGWRYHLRLVMRKSANQQPHRTKLSRIERHNKSFLILSLIHISEPTRPY